MGKSAPRATTLPQQLRDKSKAGETVEPLTALERAGAEKAVAEEVEYIARMQARIRGKDGRLKRAKFHAAVLALRFEGFAPTETANLLGCSKSRVDAALLRMRQAASIEDQLQRLDTLAVPLAVDNLVRGVMDGDKTYTLKLLDGRGVFRHHKSIEAQVTKREFQFKIVVTQPPHLNGSAIPLPIPGSIVGAPDLGQIPEQAGAETPAIDAEVVK